MITKRPDHRGRAPEQTTGAPRCVEAITALARGDLEGWTGLPADCARADVERVLSVVTRETNASVPYSGPLDYAPTSGASSGLTVHYDAGKVVYITIVQPQLTQPVGATLGEPEGKLRSQLEGAGDQWVYPRLGLAFHMKADERGVSWLYVFGPTTFDVYETSSLSRVRTLRHKVR